MEANKEILKLRKDIKSSGKQQQNINIKEKYKNPLENNKEILTSRKNIKKSSGKQQVR